ncbi:MAG: GntR family transcriptional regulator [Spirochaetes bacterium]|nr:GntR family transcriptional regulator [Spirochaetota bacterium]
MMKFMLDTKSGVPFYRQIIQQVEYNMSVGKLNTGDRLPTVRSLAIDLKINPNTVAKAYNELEIRGLVETQIGSGTFIADKKIEISEIEKKEKINKICAQFLVNLKEIGVNKKEVLKTLKKFIEEE